MAKFYIEVLWKEFASILKVDITAVSALSCQNV